MKRKRLLVFVLVAVLCVGAFACAAPADQPQGEASQSAAAEPAAPTESMEASQSAAQPAETAGSVEERLQAMQQEFGWEQPFWYEPASENTLKMAESDELDGSILNVGPNGEAAALGDDIVVSDQQADEIKGKGLKAALVMRWTGSFWPNQQIAGLTDTLEGYGVEVIATTDANQDDAKQISDIEAAMAMDPDIMFIHPVNQTTLTDVCKKVADAGIKIVFLDHPVEGLEAGKDYVTVVTCDNLLNGMRHADLMAEAMEGQEEKNVGIMYYAPEFAATNERYTGFITRMAAKYPDINIVTTSPFEDALDTQSVAAAMITANPDMNAIYTEWDEPAIGIIAAARTAGKPTDNFFITTDLMGDEVVLDLAQGGYVKGISTQQPYKQGVAEANAGVLAVLGEDVPTYIAVVPYNVTRDTLVESYEYVVGEPLFDAAKQALEQ